MSIRSRLGHRFGRRLGRLVAVPVSAVLLVGVIAACGGDGGDGLPDPPASPQPQVDDQPAALDLTPEEQEAVEAAQAAFDEFMTAYQDILTAGEPATDAVLGRILPLISGTLRRDIHAEIFDNYQAGYRADGRIDWSFVEIVDVDMERMHEVSTDEEMNVPTVRLRYCINAADWVTVDKESNEPVSEPGKQHLAAINVIYFDSAPISVESRNPTWRVNLWEDEEGQPC